MNYPKIIQTLNNEVKRQEALAMVQQPEELKRGHLDIAETLRAAAEIVSGVARSQ